MQQIVVTLNVDEYVVKAESGLTNLEDAILKELEWLRDSSMVVSALSLREPTQEPAKVFCLCEEYEGTDGIREFYIRAVSEDKPSLRKLMEAKIQTDEYGFIAKKGIDDHSLDHFATNFEDGFVEYYIVEESVLSRNEVEKLVCSQLGQSAPDNSKLPLADQISNATASRAMIVPPENAGERAAYEQERA